VKTVSLSLSCGYALAKANRNPETMQRSLWGYNNRLTMAAVSELKTCSFGCSLFASPLIFKTPYNNAYDQLE
jgi:hypothetical protein